MAAALRLIALVVVAAVVLVSPASGVLFHHNAAHKHFDPIPAEVQERLMRDRLQPEVNVEEQALPSLCVEEALVASEQQKAQWREAAKVRLPELGIIPPTFHHHFIAHD